MTWFPTAAEDQTCVFCEYLTRITDITEDTESGFEYYVARYPLFTHAAMTWGRHAFQAFGQEQNLRESRSYKVVKVFLHSPRTVQFVIETLRRNIKLVWNRLPKQSFSRYWTSLHLATFFGLTEIVKDFLSENGGMANVAARGGDSLVSLAAACGYRPTLDFVLGDNVNANRRKFDEALLGAAQAGNRDISRMVLGYGADPTKSAPLFIASRDGHEDIVRLLLNATPGLVKPVHGESVLVANKNGHSNIVRFFFERGAAMYANFGKLLSATIKRRDKDMARFLLGVLPRRGAVEPEEITELLFLAIAEDDVSMVELLLEHGANTQGRNQDGLTPREVAYERNQDDIQKAIASWEKKRRSR
ncbi:ankyrin repeat-containing domain protein [Colletotrichum phormii]|uniref:Ankyrin repeat-containing domain protein n=1 Tax=Colletotrichum phormii TaxID=359342 RepID=A0AAJ0A398_9PEZI|nr:ankyrin repeat-containing domain protein [Colletotrichum phormii]KAK1654281.1 ankyrin repeat-containing domain protein [Colletotrichum phormii]